jgi:glycopeptide antibiotics resistance protein
LILTLVLTLTPPVVAMAAPESVLDTRLSLPSRPQTVINLLLLWWIVVPVPLLGRRGVLATTAMALGASVAIELAQALLAGGRSASVMDVLLNTGGALVMATITVALVRPLLARLSPSDERVPTRPEPV